MQAEYITTKEAANILGLKPKTLYNWKVLNKLPFPYYALGRLRFKRGDVVAYAESLKITPLK